MPLKHHHPAAVSIMGLTFTQGISADIVKTENDVRSYIPKSTVVAHRGTTCWTPEEREAAFSWARNVSTNYLGADLQLTKSGIILPLHDEILTRTDNIKDIYPTNTGKVANSFSYKNSLKLDAVSWFNKESRTKKSFQGLGIHTYSFDTTQQMQHVTIEGVFTNHSNLGLQFHPRPSTKTSVFSKDNKKLLNNLGY